MCVGGSLVSLTHSSAWTTIGVMIHSAINGSKQKPLASASHFIYIKTHM